MSNKGLFKLLSLAIIASLIGILVVNNQGGKQLSQQPWLDFTAESISEITFTNAADKVSVVKVLENWQISELDGYAADVKKLAEFIKALKTAKVSEFKTKQAKFHHKLGLQDITVADSQATLVEISTAKQTLSFLLGKTAGNTGHYARFSTEAQTILLDKTIPLPSDKNAWMKSQIFDMDYKQVTELSVQLNGSESFVIERKPLAVEELVNEKAQIAAATGQVQLAEEFTLVKVIEGKTLTYPGILSGLVRNLINLDAKSVTLDPAPNLKDVATFAVHFSQQQTELVQQVSLYKSQLSSGEEGEYSYWLQLAEKDWLFEVSEYKAKQISKALNEYFQN